MAHKNTHTFEDVLIKRIKAGIFGIRNSTKSPSEAGCGSLFTRLKTLNEPMYQELLNDYKAAINQYNLQDKSRH